MYVCDYTHVYMYAIRNFCLCDYVHHFYIYGNMYTCMCAYVHVLRLRTHMLYYAYYLYVIKLHKTRLTIVSTFVFIRFESGAQKSRKRKRDIPSNKSNEVHTGFH